MQSWPAGLDSRYAKAACWVHAIVSCARNRSQQARRQCESRDESALPSMQVLAALRDTDVPVPRALCLATDASVIGTPFYVMEHVQVCPQFPTGRHIVLSPISNQALQKDHHSAPARSM